MQRYFGINKNLELDTDDIYHITKVMRMRKGDNICIIWDKINYICEIEEVNYKDVKYRVVEKIKENNEIDINITVAFTLVNETKTDFIIQKCTELGVSEFIPIITERSKIKINKNFDKKIERWSKIAKEAAEQSHRNIIPKVLNIHTLDDLKKLEYKTKLLCSTKEEEKNIKNRLQNLSKYDTIIIVVGPEGGITESEEEILNENGFDSISLGTTILRTETAPIFAVCAIKYELMR